MKRNEIKELHTKTAKELWDMLNKLKKEVMKLRIDLAQNKVSNVRLISRKLDDTARVQTILRGREKAVARGGLVK